MNIYTALRDVPGNKSVLVGVFSTGKLARDACQEELDEDSQVTGTPRRPLIWEDDQARLPDGDTYVVILATLNIRAGMG